MRRDVADIPEFELPRRLEKILAALSVYFQQREKSLLSQLLVNSRYVVSEGTDYDNWNGGLWGHTVHFEIPSVIFYQVFDTLHDVASEIQSGINRLGSIDNEHVVAVQLEMQDDASLDDWRQNSGLLLAKSPLAVPTSEDDLRRLWEPGFLRVFLSHKSQYKEQTADLQKCLLHYGFSAFVAHADIEPTKPWQEEIEKALFSMHVLLPLLTDGFHDSDWTDQEIGVAIGRGVPIVAVKLGTDPYGFIGKYQAISGDLSRPIILAKSLAALFATHKDLDDLANEAFVTQFERAANYGEANTLMEFIDSHMTRATPTIIERLAAAPAKNSQVDSAFKVKKLLPDLLRRLRIDK